MKIKEAIERLKRRVGVSEWANLDYVDLVEIDDLKLAIAALEKQEAKKPTPVAEGSTWNKCPICGDTYIDEYCGKCGQKLDWSEVDEC